MKTTIKTLIVICAFGIAGVVDINATPSYKTSSKAETLEEAKSLKSDNLNIAEFVFDEDADAVIDYQKEAQLVTKWIADQEEARTVQKLISEGIFVSNKGTAPVVVETKSDNLNLAEFVFNEDEDADAVIDYQKEAQLVTKWIADKEEAKAIQKLIEEGKLAENK